MDNIKEILKDDNKFEDLLTKLDDDSQSEDGEQK